MSDLEPHRLALGRSPVAVFSHPNHELAVLGMIRQLDCPIIYLTDGGSPTRVASSRKGLSEIGHRGSLIFLGRTEHAYYEALLQRQDSFFEAVAEEVASHLQILNSDAILTEPVEFYNPVHDLTPAIVRRTVALAGPHHAVYETPLIYEAPGESSYIINRFPPSQKDAFDYAVPDAIVDAKFSLYHEVYHDLRAQLQSLQCEISRNWFAKEHYRMAISALEEPDGRRVLRYERRGQLLQRRGLVKEVITYRHHFLPTVSRLLRTVG